MIGLNSRTGDSTVVEMTTGSELAVYDHTDTHHTTSDPTVSD
jgi:hypothetical protein